MAYWKENITILDTEKVTLPNNNPKKPYYNPSLCWHNGKLVISIRSSTWTRDEHGNQATILGTLHSDIILGEIDPVTFKAKNLRKLEYSGDLHPYIKNSGMEDVRLFVRDNKIHAIGVCMSKNDRNGSTVHLAHGVIEGDKLVFKELLKKPYPNRIEKNWIPPELPTKAFDFIYSPTQTIKNGVLSDGIEYHGRVHGGSQAIKWEDGYLSFVHKIHKLRQDWNGNFQYVNYAMKYDKSGRATHISKGFLLLGDNQVEFLSGMVLHEGKFIVSVGVGDSKVVLARIDPSRLAFEPFDPIQEPIRIYFDGERELATAKEYKPVFPVE